MFDEIDKAYLRQKLDHYHQRLQELEGKPGANLYRGLARAYQFELDKIEGGAVASLVQCANRGDESGRQLSGAALAA